MQNNLQVRPSWVLFLQSTFKVGPFSFFQREIFCFSSTCLSVLTLQTDFIERSVNVWWLFQWILGFSSCICPFSLSSGSSSRSDSFSLLCNGCSSWKRSLLLLSDLPLTRHSAGLRHDWFRCVRWGVFLPCVRRASRAATQIPLRRAITRSPYDQSCTCINNLPPSSVALPSAQTHLSTCVANTVTCPETRPHLRSPASPHSRHATVSELSTFTQERLFSTSFRCFWGTLFPFQAALQFCSSSSQRETFYLYSAPVETFLDSYKNMNKYEKINL